MPSKALTYSAIYNDVEKIKSYWSKYKPDYDIEAIDLENWQGMIPLFEQLSIQNSVMILIWNWKLNRFVYAIDKRKLVGYDLDSYTCDNGVDFTISNMHPQFIDAVLLMQQEGFKHFNFISKHEQENTIVNYDAKIKRSTGEYFHYLQQVVPIDYDINGYTLLFLSYIHDITHLKKDKTANCVIKTFNTIKWWNFNFEKKCLEFLKPLSKLEQKVLSYLSLGKSSKEIAIELFISPFTVDTHRRHLLHKTNCIDTTGMITYCRLAGLL